MSSTLSIRLPDDLVRWLRETSKRTGQPQGELIRIQLEKARAASEEKPWMRWAGVIDGPSDLSCREGFPGK
ncbi:MAG: ribbon-helix-helix protein, CopG family [Verrucomicrobiales bacterium]|nr:ribbon-helix-helix protein, CopG family [Verrucomicrobiales bacterium]